MINALKNMYGENLDVEYSEVIVKDGVETSRVLLAIEDHYDFILVGRRLESDSSLVTGLTDWSYMEELGIIGDILASSDMKVNASRSWHTPAAAYRVWLNFISDAIVDYQFILVLVFAAAGVESAMACCMGWSGSGSELLLSWNSSDGVFVLGEFL
ncbi:Cation/H(+) antiporter 14 [Camellia lanceoleosa]|uniref:Cation/H(+) antiporter 14 n=1 Tax=Camellia lanceoleosa TaxID=1840588 RepID=A0ACC0HC32_9ERIC|nr:Cation/H(+) antiporter 14 [Camellia lanceoleosa]